MRPGDPFAQALINSLQDEGDNLARKVGLACKRWAALDMHSQALACVLDAKPTPAAPASLIMDTDCAGDAQDEDAGPANGAHGGAAYQHAVAYGRH